METRPLLSPFFHHSFLRKSALDLAVHSLSSPRLAKAPDTPAAASESNFEIEDLLDFPHEDDAAAAAAVSLCPVPGYAATEGHHLLGFAAENPRHCSDKVPKPEEAASAPPSAGLSVPPEELADELEWLSTFNEDSSYTGDTQLASLVSSGGLGNSLDSPRSSLKRRETSCIRSPVSVLEQNGHQCAANSSYVLIHSERPKSSRSARSRGRGWSVNILKPVFVENRHKVSHGSSSLSIDASPPLHLHHEKPKPKKTRRSLSCTGEGFHGISVENRQKDSIFECNFPVNELGDGDHASLQGHYYRGERPAGKKPKSSGSCEDPAASARRCSHCLVQKTPQWRAGPLGPKTLCNACGVRYKSGRLLPEYRPASSPTFVSEVHSNSHRRILEMRRARELDVLTASQLAKMQEDDECTSTVSASSGKASFSSYSSCDDLLMPASKAVAEGCEEMCVNSKSLLGE